MKLIKNDTRLTQKKKQKNENKIIDTSKQIKTAEVKKYTLIKILKMKI